jgi:crotonobetainyl-CoA:carnitine CoA-transferase CaiB-like acyl-CoA transferase
MGTQILGDQGANVIKVEGLTGAAERGSARQKMTSPLFSVLNRNKKSLSVDLKTEGGVEVFKKLVANSDIIIQNFRPGVADRMGIGYEDMKAINNKIIYVSISGFGAKGPYSQKVGYVSYPCP